MKIVKRPMYANRERVACVAKPWIRKRRRRTTQRVVDEKEAEYKSLLMEVFHAIYGRRFNKTGVVGG